MSDEAIEAFVCGDGEHHWVSSHEPHAPIWIIKCSQCGRHDFTEMLAAHDREVAAKALREFADTIEPITTCPTDVRMARARAAALVPQPSTPEGRAWCHARHQCHHWFEDGCSDACDRGEHDHPHGGCTPEQPEGENRG